MFGGFFTITEAWIDFLRSQSWIPFPSTSIALVGNSGEFMDGGFVRKRSVDSVQCPDPLESGVFIGGKDFRKSLKPKARKHFDVGSTKLSR